MPGGVWRPKRRGKLLPYRCRIRYPDGTARVVSTGQREFKAALAAYRRLQGDAAAGFDRTPRVRVTLGELLTAYLESCEVQGGHSSSGCSPETLSMYGHKVNALTKTLGSDFPVEDLSLAVLEGYIRRRRCPPVVEGKPARKIADVTIGKELGVLRAALKVGKKKGLWRGDLDEVLPRFRASSIPRRRYLTVDEYGALMRALEPRRGYTDRRPTVAFLVMTGARDSEWQAVEVRHVQLEAGRLVLPGTKTHGARRELPIAEHAPLVALLEQLVKDRPPHARLLPPWASIRHELAWACGRAKIERVSPNDLRRTFATWLRLAGTPLDRIARLLGHRDSTMVERVYGQLPVEALTGDVGRVWGALKLPVVTVTRDKGEA